MGFSSGNQKRKYIILHIKFDSKVKYTEYLTWCNIRVAVLDQRKICLKYEFKLCFLNVKITLTKKLCTPFNKNYADGGVRRRYLMIFAELKKK